MRSKLIIALVAAAVLAFACGPRSPSAEPARKTAAGGPPFASSLDVRVNHQVAFLFHVTNNNPKRVELTFPSGQTHDIVVLDSIGREVWRWSNGRLFTQALQNRVLESSETMTYQAQWNPLDLHGQFVAVASLMSENHPLQQRLEFVLP